MLIYSMSVSVDGFVADRDGSFDWGATGDELFAFHLDRVRGLRGYVLGRRLYEAMLVWETDPAMRSDAARDEFADVWCALPKVVFSRTLPGVHGNARLATGSLAEEVAALSGDAGGDVEIGGPILAGEAIELGLVDELRIFRIPIVVGGGSAFLPPVTSNIALDLVETRAFETRVVYERYRRAGGARLPHQG